MTICSTNQNFNFLQIINCIIVYKKAFLWCIFWKTLNKTDFPLSNIIKYNNNEMKTFSLIDKVTTFLMYFYIKN